MELQTTPALEEFAATLLAAAAALPERHGLADELAFIEAAAARGYFLPDEEKLLKLRYSQYLTLRTSLLATISTLGTIADGRGTNRAGRLPVFATTFAATCVLLRANRFVVDLAAQRPVLWKKLDEPDAAAGIPRKSFTTVFKAPSHPSNQIRFPVAADYFQRHREEIRALSADPVLQPVVDLLESEETRIETRRRAAMKRHFSYRWFSILRRHRSAWQQVMGGLFEISSRAISDLRQPGVNPHGAPKRIHPALRAQVLAAGLDGGPLLTGPAARAAFESKRQPLS